MTPGRRAPQSAGCSSTSSISPVRQAGPPPLPDPPDISHVEGLRALAGNQQFREVAKQSEQLRQDIKLWATASEQRATREAAWGILERLLNHAAGLDGAVDVRKQRDAIASGQAAPR